jgi:hypothetical protein
MAGKCILTDEFKRACDRFLKSRGELHLSFRDMVHLGASEGERKKLTQEETIEKVAREIENNSKGLS